MKLRARTLSTTAVLISIASMLVCASFAKLIFLVISAEVTTALRQTFSAVVL